MYCSSTAVGNTRLNRKEGVYELHTGRRELEEREITKQTHKQENNNHHPQKYYFYKPYKMLWIAQGTQFNAL